MATSFGIIKGALRSYSDGEYIHALLELNDLIERERECWTAYLVKAKINAALHRDYEAITDLALVLEMSSNLNERHRRYLMATMALCANRLADKQKFELNRYFKKGAAPRKKKLGMGAHVVNTGSNGKIAQLGKFLIDARDMEKLSNLVLKSDSAVSGIDIISLEDAKSYSNLLQKIDRQPGVIGSCIIGRDFYIRASTLPDDYDPEPFGINGLVAFLSAKENDRLVEFYRDGQVLFLCDLGHLLILEFAGGILITLSKERDLLKLVKLAHKIARLVR